MVLQEIFGVNEFVRNVADWYAAHGFVALAPDLVLAAGTRRRLTDQKPEHWEKGFCLLPGT